MHSLCLYTLYTIYTLYIACCTVISQYGQCYSNDDGK